MPTIPRSKVDGIPYCLLQFPGTPPAATWQLWLLPRIGKDSMEFHQLYCVELWASVGFTIYGHSHLLLCNLICSLRASKSRGIRPYSPFAKICLQRTFLLENRSLRSFTDKARTLQVNFVQRTTVRKKGLLPVLITSLSSMDFLTRSLNSSLQLLSYVPR